MDAQPKFGGLDPPSRRTTATDAAPPPDGPIRRALAAVQISPRRQSIATELVQEIERLERH